MSEELIRVENLKKYFKTPGGMLHAVDDISFSLDKGKTLGVVGESGCGKSTLGRTVLGILEATEGSVYFEGKDITHLKGKEKRESLKQMQMIFQDPYASLNPRYCVRELIADPLKAFHLLRGAELEKKVDELMETVGLAKRLGDSYPHELDGGRRQRIGIARALALDPKFIVCDEPVSALDVSIQAQILNLLQDLQEERGLSYIFVTHDLSVVRHISDDILVMYLGTLVEKCSAEALFDRRYHPYTKALMSAIPIPSIRNRSKRIIMKGELTSPINPAPGCRFASRCPYASEECFKSQPKLEEIEEGHFVACHKVRELNDL